MGRGRGCVGRRAAGEGAGYAGEAPWRGRGAEEGQPSPSEPQQVEAVQVVGQACAGGGRRHARTHTRARARTRVHPHTHTHKHKHKHTQTHTHASACARARARANTHTHSRPGAGRGLTGVCDAAKDEELRGVGGHNEARRAAGGGRNAARCAPDAGPLQRCRAELNYVAELPCMTHRSMSTDEDPEPVHGTAPRSPVAPQPP